MDLLVLLQVKFYKLELVEAGDIDQNLNFFMRFSHNMASVFHFRTGQEVHRNKQFGYKNNKIDLFLFLSQLVDENVRQ